MHQRLSSSLRSCHVTHSLSTYTCTVRLPPPPLQFSALPPVYTPLHLIIQFVFVPLDLGGQPFKEQGDVILRQSIPAPDPKKNSSDLGQTLLGQWEARVTLLGLTLELQQYLNGKHGV